MKIVSVQALAIRDIQVIQFARFCDHRGYFTELFRKSDFQTSPLTPFMRNIEFRQTNESFSRTGTVRGLHFQWNPYMGKLVRTVHGHMVDLVLDIRKGSPTFGKIVAHDMPARLERETNEWIWVPPGFAHGNFFLEDTTIEYFCSGEWSPKCEAGISPLSDDLDWSLCEPSLKREFERIAPVTSLITDKDRAGFSLSSWAKDDRSNHFVYGRAAAQRARWSGEDRSANGLDKLGYYNIRWRKRLEEIAKRLTGAVLELPGELQSRH